MHYNYTSPEHRAVYVLLLNWNGWGHTLECLESLFRLRTPGLRVIVCDNASEDGSLTHLQAWAEGRLDAMPGTGRLRHLSQPPAPKPIACRIYDRAVAERGGDRNGDATPLILIRNGANLGFGGGNNVGLRYALTRGDFESIWILNNDTVVEPNALDTLLARMSDGDFGMCGSTVLFYHRPDEIQCQGGAHFHPWLGISRLLGLHRPRNRPLSPSRVEDRLDHLYGASMLVSRPFLEAIGPMSEDNFLYFEEMDWALRAAGRFRIGYAPDSHVYHKKGAAAGTGTRRDGRNPLATYHLARGRVRFTRRHFPLALPLVYGVLALEAFARVLLGDRRRARALLDALAGTPPRRPRPPGTQ